MNTTFADSLKSLRTARGLSQQQLAAKLFVDRSTIARWETGGRMPDLSFVPRIAECLDVDTTTLYSAVQDSGAPEIIVVDDERIALAGAISVLEEAFPTAAITGFTKPSDALAYAQAHPISIAMLDIEIGHTSGLDLCRALIGLYPHVNVVFLTAYRNYSFDAWETGACGFLLKPITVEAILSQVERLHHPVTGLRSLATRGAADHQQTAQC